MMIFLKGKSRKLLFNMGISYTNSFLGFLTFLLLAKLLGAIDYAVVAIGIAVGGFIVPLLDLGSAKTFVRDAVISERIDGVEYLSQSSFNIRLTVAIVLSMFVFVFGYIYIDSTVKMISIGLLSLWVGFMGLYPTSWFDYFHKTSHQNLYVMVERILVVLSIGMIMYINLNTWLILIVSIMLFAVRVISIIYQIMSWRKKYAKHRFNFRFSFPRIGSPGINLHFTIALLFNALLFYGNQLILAKAGNEIELSAYSFSFQLISLVFLFQSQAIRILNRDISEVSKSGVQGNIIKHLINHVIFLFIASVVLSFCIYLIAKYIPFILEDTRFERVGEFMPILCVWVIVAGVGQVITQYLLELKQEYFHLLVSVVSGVSAFILGLIFIPEYGAISISLILVIVHSIAILVRIIKLLFMSRKSLVSNRLDYE